MASPDFLITKNTVQAPITELTPKVAELNQLIEELCQFKLSQFRKQLIAGNFTLDDFPALELAFPRIADYLHTPFVNEYFPKLPHINLYLNTGLYVGEWEFITWNRTNWAIGTGEEKSLIKPDGKQDLLIKMQKRYEKFLEDTRKTELDSMSLHIFDVYLKKVFAFETAEDAPWEDIAEILYNSFVYFGTDKFVKPLISLDTHGGGIYLKVLDFSPKIEP